MALSALETTVLTLLVAVAAGVLGAWLRRRVPEHHLNEDTVSVMKLVLGLVATMAALVLGLLIASAKTTFDTQTADLQTLSVAVIRLDDALVSFGPEAAPARALLRHGIEVGYQSLDPNGPGMDPTQLPAKQLSALMEDLRGLQPTTDLQRLLQATALDVAGQIHQTRLLMAEQMVAPLDTPYLIILVFWIVVLFLGFGLFTPLNWTVLVAMAIGGASVSSALFLILEMSTPYTGLIRISPAPLAAALEQMAR